VDIPKEHRDFLESHRLCVFGYNRRHGPPVLTPVYYYLDGDELVVSTTSTRGKAKAVQRNPEVRVCVLDEKPPFAYLTVFGHARVEKEGAVEAMMRVGEKLTGNPVAEAARPALEQRAKAEGRVVLRVKPRDFVSTLPLGPRGG
jgi:PPOX class probable F420-dependent enzyme